MSLTVCLFVSARAAALASSLGNKLTGGKSLKTVLCVAFKMGSVGEGGEESTPMLGRS